MDVEVDLPEYTVKMLLVGATNVGKSVLLARWATGDFLPVYVPTLGTDCRMKVEQFGEVRARVIVWELSGNENHRMFLPVLFRSMDAVLCVFSIADRKSFECIGGLVNDLVIEGGPKPFLIGTHAEPRCPCARTVPKDEVDAFAKKQSMEYLDNSNEPDVSVLSRAACFLVEERKRKDDEEKKKNLEKGKSQWCCFCK